MNQVAPTKASKVAAAMAALGSFAPSGKPYMKMSGNTGIFTMGSDEKVIENGSEVAMNMKTFKAGWVCWKNDDVVDEVMAAPFEGEMLTAESDLKDHGPYDDEEDGWKKQVSVDLRILDLPGAPEVTFKSSAAGGITALTNFFKEFVRETQLNGDSVIPIVPLDSDSYMPKDKKLGKKHFPVFKVAEWTTEEKLASAFGAEESPENYEKPEAKQIAAPVKEEKPAPTEVPVKEEKPAVVAEPATTPAAEAAPGGRRKRFV